MTLPPPSGECAPGTQAPLLPLATATRLARAFQALSDPTRVRLLNHVAGAEGGTVCACHLPGQLGISQPTLSHHLKRLVDSGLLLREQRGRWAHYAVAEDALVALATFVADPAERSTASVIGR